MTSPAHLHASLSEAQESNVIDLSQRFTDKRLTRELEREIDRVISATRKSRARIKAHLESAERHVELPADTEWQEG